MRVLEAVISGKDFERANQLLEVTRLDEKNVPCVGIFADKKHLFIFSQGDKDIVEPFEVEVTVSKDDKEFKQFRHDFILGLNPFNYSLLAKKMWFKVFKGDKKIILRSYGYTFDEAVARRAETVGLKHNEPYYIRLGQAREILDCIKCYRNGFTYGCDIFFHEKVENWVNNWHVLVTTVQAIKRTEDGRFIGKCY